MRIQSKADIEERFHQLAVKEALGTITPAEHRKLERYAALRRVDDPLPREVRVSDYRLRLLRKRLGSWSRFAEQYYAWEKSQGDVLPNL